MANQSIEKTVYFVRHGQSEDNVSPVYQSPDSPLSEVGRRQAEKIAERISKLSYDVLVASPYPRSKETAEIIGRLTSKEPEFSDLFTERRKPTSVNGKAYTDGDAGKTWRAWEKSLTTTGVRVEDGENYSDIVDRADRALMSLKDRPEKTILVVTHGYFLNVIIARVLVGDALSAEVFAHHSRMLHMENTGITVIHYRGAFEEDVHWRLWTYNDHAHLDE